MSHGRICGVLHTSALIAALLVEVGKDADEPCCISDWPNLTLISVKLISTGGDAKVYS